MHVVSVVLNYLNDRVDRGAGTSLMLRVLNLPSGMRMVAVALMATSALYFRVVYIGLEFGLLVPVGLLLLGAVLYGS